MTAETTRLRALLERATPRPWHNGGLNGDVVGTVIEDDAGDNVALLSRRSSEGPASEDHEAWANGDIIVAAVNALPALCDELDALRALRPHPARRTGHGCARCGRDGADSADGLCAWCDDGVRAEAELDALRAEVEALTAERDAVRAEWQRHVRGTEDTVRLLLPHTLATARREGAEEMREAILDALPCVTAEQDECAARIHRVALPVVREGGE